MNIFQKAITPDMPRVLEGEQIYVYVPQATSTNAGIASYKNEDFKVNDGAVSLRWPAKSLTQGPLANPSLIKVQEDEFEYTNTEVNLDYEGSRLTSSILDVQLKRDLRDAYNRPDLVMLDQSYFPRTIVEKDGKQYYKYNTTAVHYNIVQALTDIQKQQARENIGASSNTDIKFVNDRIDELLETGVYTVNGQAGNVVLTTNDIMNNSDYTTNAYVNEQLELINTNKADITYVDQKIADLVGSAPDTLDTLAELANALKNNEDIVTVLEDSIATKANKTDLNSYLPLAGGTMTGPVILGQGDTNALFLGSNGCINAGTSGSKTLFGLSSSGCVAGQSDYALNLRGSQTRPSYNAVNLALVTDIPSTLDSYTTFSSDSLNGESSFIFKEATTGVYKRSNFQNFINSFNVALASDIPTSYIKTASVSGNALTLTKQDNTTLEFVGEPSTYIKTANVTGTTLTLTKQDNTTLEFVGEPSTYIKTANVTGTTLTLTDKAGITTTFSSGVYKGTCSTGSNTSTKKVICPGFVLKNGVIIDVTFTYSNGGLVKLNVNNTGEKNIVYKEIGLTSDYNTTTSAGGADKSIPYGGWSAGDTVRFFYDGSTWVEIMNLTQGIPYSIPYQAKNAYVSRTQDNTDNSTNIATTAFVHTAIEAALEAGTGSEDIYLPLAGGQMTGQLLLDSSGLLFPNVYRLSGEGIMPNANTTQFKMYKPGDAFTKGLIYNYDSGVVELIARPTVNGTNVALTSDLSSYITKDSSNIINNVAGMYGKLLGNDTRSINGAPSTYQSQALTMSMGIEFKSSSAINSPISNDKGFVILQTINPWGDITGGLPSQLSYGSKLSYRTASSSSAWNSWRTIIDSGGGTIDSGCTLTINGSINLIV